MNKSLLQQEIEDAQKAFNQIPLESLAEVAKQWNGEGYSIPDIEAFRAKESINRLFDSASVGDRHAIECLLELIGYSVDRINKLFGKSRKSVIQGTGDKNPSEVELGAVEVGCGNMLTSLFDRVSKLDPAEGLRLGAELFGADQMSSTGQPLKIQAGLDGSSNQVVEEIWWRMVYGVLEQAISCQLPGLLREIVRSNLRWPTMRNAIKELSIEEEARTRFLDELGDATDLRLKVAKGRAREFSPDKVMGFVLGLHRILSCYRKSKVQHREWDVARMKKSHDAIEKAISDMRGQVEYKSLDSLGEKIRNEIRFELEKTFGGGGTEFSTLSSWADSGWSRLGTALEDRWRWKAYELPDLSDRPNEVVEKWIGASIAFLECECKFNLSAMDLPSVVRKRISVGKGGGAEGSRKSLYHALRECLDTGFGRLAKTIERKEK